LYRLAVRATDWTPSPPPAEVERDNNEHVAACSEDTDDADIPVAVHHSAELYVTDDDDEKSDDERL